MREAGGWKDEDEDIKNACVPFDGEVVKPQHTRFSDHKFDNFTQTSSVRNKQQTTAQWTPKGNSMSSTFTFLYLYLERELTCDSAKSKPSSFAYCEISGPALL